MFDQILNFFDKFQLFDLIYLTLTILSLIKCSSKGFVLSILSASKWLFSYVVALYLFPKAKPFVEGILDNEYVLDIVLGLSIFIIVLFIVLMINKGISKAVSYSGIGTLDKIFGFSILVLSNFIPTIYFGVFTGIAMFLAMILVLTLLPSLILYIRPFEKN